MVAALLTLAGLGVVPAAHAADPAALDQAFARLVSGRNYLRGFPELKTRSGLIADFLGRDGVPPSWVALVEARDQALAIRQAVGPGSTGAAESPVAADPAQAIAWQALEGLLGGYLYAGNHDLLRATRVAYPGSDQVSDPRELPAEEPIPFRGVAQLQLAYARLYFLQGIKDALAYVAADPTGELRATGSEYPTIPHLVTFDDEESGVLPFPRFDDPNFGGPAQLDREAGASAAFLYGNALERFGLAVVAYADKLWRSAFAGPSAGQSRTPEQRRAMLRRATEVLRENVHAQYLAALPLAAHLSDGSDGSQSEFAAARLDQARVSVTQALRLRSQILSGERPTQATLDATWDPASIERQISVCEAAYRAAAEKYGGAGPDTVQAALAAEEEAQSRNAGDAIELRLQVVNQLQAITRIAPAAFGDLADAPSRALYLAAVTNKINRLIDSRNPADPQFADGSAMSSQALQFMLALQEAIAQRAEVDGYAVRMRIETERNDDENATVTLSGAIYKAIELAIGAAEAAPKISVCACGMASGSETSSEPSALATAAQEALRAMSEADETARINAINSRAIIRNLLVDQFIAIQGLRAAMVNIGLARAELLQSLAEVQRLVEDHAFIQDVTAPLWYRDPSLAFRLEKVEEEYQVLTQDYRIELYKLGRMLEAAWAERFQNPVRTGNEASVALNQSFDGFTEAESIFGAANHVEARAFFDALRAWDNVLRGVSYRGPFRSTLLDANLFSGQPISLRRDIFGLVDYRYDEELHALEKDEALERRSIQRFRAILLDLARRDPANLGPAGLVRLRIDFPFTYQQTRVILGRLEPDPIVRRDRPDGRRDSLWNHRIAEFGIRIVGRNVFVAGNDVTANFEAYGSLQRVSFFGDSPIATSGAITTFPVPLYQRDPDLRLGEPFFGGRIVAAIGDTPLTAAPVDGWPLFCDNMILRIDAQNSLRIENMEDIEFVIRMQNGSPPPVQWP